VCYRHGIWACFLLISIVAISVAEDRVVQKAEQAASEQVVYLDRTADFAFRCEGRTNRAILLREIARQAILIAARDELGLSTRDASLGDAMSSDVAQPPIRLTTQPLVPPKLIVYRGTVALGTLLVQVVKSLDSESPSVDIHKYLAETEGFSRTSFVEALKKAGFQGTAVAFHPEAGVPEEIDKNLNEMVFTSQFAAVRELHALIRTSGESPARLGALVRAYANLGVLTEFHWHPAHKVFKARALLYAQRLAAKQNDPLSRLHLGYALGMAGMPDAASIALTEGLAGFKVAKQGEKTSLPAWAELIAAHCQFNLEPLQPEKVDPPSVELARLLRYLTVELAAYPTATVREGLEAAGKMPECYRIHDGACTNGGVASLHRTTLTWILIAGKKLYSRIAAMPALPEPVAELARKIVAQRAATEDDNAAVVKEFRTRNALVQALLETDAPSKSGSKKTARDMGEPSWAVLGNLIRELSFMQAWRRVDFEVNWLSVAPDNFIELTAPLVEGHPFAPFLRTFSSDPDEKAKAWKHWTLQHPEGLEITSIALWSAYVKHSWFADGISQHVHESIDETARDLYLFSKSKRSLTQEDVQAILRVAKASPYARSIALEMLLETSKRSDPVLQKQARDFPGLASSIARNHRMFGELAEAEQWLKVSVAACPEPRAYEELARIYKNQGKTDAWIATLDEYLKQPDYGLSHGMVRATLARHFMANKEWDKALPYAQGAAETYAQWGLMVGAECQEGMQHWEAAESLARAASERYTCAALHWYLFCRRTGQGDLEAARKLAMAVANSDTNFAGEQKVAAFWILEKQPEKAQQIFAGYFTQNNPVFGLHVALLADELKNTRRRDEILARLSEQRNRYRPASGGMAYVHLASLARMLANDLAKGGKGDVDLAEADRVNQAYPLPDESPSPCDLERNDPRNPRIAFNYFLGRYLDLHGKPKEAIVSWKKCVAETEFMFDLHRSLAGAELTARGIAPELYKAAKKPKSTSPPYDQGPLETE